MAYARTDLLFLGRMNVRYHENRGLPHYSGLLTGRPLRRCCCRARLSWRWGAFCLERHTYKEPLLMGVTYRLGTALNGAVLAFGMFNKFTTHADLKKRSMGFSLG